MRAKGWNERNNTGKLIKLGLLAFILILPHHSAQAAAPLLAQQISLVTVPAAEDITPAPVYAGNAARCTEAVTICARAMQPLGVAVGGSFTVRIEDHFSATYECTMINGTPRWAPATQKGSCAPQPVIILPAKYDDDDPWNVG